jgi:phosphoglycolate phosphatase
MKQILFDLDGTLTDSGVGIIHCAQQTLEHYHLPIPSKEELRVIVGPPLRQSLLQFGVAEENLEEAINIYRKHYMDHGKLENFPYPGIESLLQKLKAEGHQLYVATSKPEALAIEILEHFHLAHYFDRICGAASDTSRETKAKVIQYLLDLIEPVSGKVIMIGDTIFDIQGANELHLPSIGVRWGYGVIEDMLDAGAIGVADTMEELYALISSF